MNNVDVYFLKSKRNLLQTPVSAGFNKSSVSIIDINGKEILILKNQQMEQTITK